MAKRAHDMASDVSITTAEVVRHVCHSRHQNDMFRLSDCLNDSLCMFSHVTGIHSDRWIQASCRVDWALSGIVVFEHLPYPPLSIFNLQLKYKKDLRKMKGSSAYQTLNTEDNLTLKSARKINKLMSEVRDICNLMLRRGTGEQMEGILIWIDIYYLQFKILRSRL